MREAKLTIAPDARAALVSLIGGDRQASRSEIRKLALYAHGKGRVELDDVLAVVADARRWRSTTWWTPPSPGRAPRRKRNSPRRCRPALRRAPSCVGAALRDAIAQGAGGARRRRDRSTAMRSFIPPVHFRRKTMVEAALNWTSPRLGRPWSNWPKPPSTSGAPRRCRRRWRNAPCSPSPCRRGARRVKLSAATIHEDRHGTSYGISFKFFPSRLDCFSRSRVSRLNPRRSRPGLSEQDHQARRAVRSRRADRCRGAHRVAGGAIRLGQNVVIENRSGRRRRHRHQVRRRRRSRWLHAAARHQRDARRRSRRW